MNANQITDNRVKDIPDLYTTAQEGQTSTFTNTPPAPHFTPAVEEVASVLDTSHSPTEREQRIAIATHLTTEALDRNLQTLQRELDNAESFGGKVLSFLKMERAAGDISNDIDSIKSARDEITNATNIDLPFLNEQLIAAGLEPITEEQLQSDLYASSAELLTGVDSISSSIELLNNEDLNLGATVTRSLDDFCFTYDEEQLQAEMQYSTQMAPTVSGNPFTKRFAKELEEILVSPQHLRILGTHTREDGVSESPDQQALRMYENLLQLSKDSVLMNFPRAREHFAAGGSEEEIASDHKFGVTLDFRSSPDCIQKHGGGAIPHVDTGNGARAAVLLYQSGNEEPLGTRLVADAAMSPSLEIASREKYGVNESSNYMSDEETASFLDPSRPAQEQKLEKWFGPEVHSHIIKTAQGEVAFFHQANANESNANYLDERNKKAPLHYGIALPRQNREPSDPRIGASRICVFIAPNERAEK